MKYALLGLAMVVLAGAAFFAGLHWKKYEVQEQLTHALGTSLVCVASSIEDDVNVASLLDREDSATARAILAAGIKSGDAKLKAFGPYSSKNDQEMTKDALKDGEGYLATKHAR